MSSLKLDFNLKHPEIEIQPSAESGDILGLEAQLGIELPPSYKEFVTKYSNGLFVDIGNALTLFPLFPNKFEENQDFTLSGSKKLFAEIEEVGSEGFLPFGMNGVDFETWAFYTSVRFNDGEYPIILLLPGACLLPRFTSFLGFLNFTVNWLILTDLDKKEDFYSKKWKELYKKYDPRMKPIPVDEDYENCASVSILARKMRELVNIK
ncbi:MAG: SMI1/KNR4 family protein [SAR202 cluster bacterium]|nr:SMI1/KNR4 family protein [SAR202 cluster bacterium]